MLGELGLTTDRGDQVAQRRADKTRLSGDQRKREGPVIVDPDRSGTLTGPAQSSATLLRKTGRAIPSNIPSDPFGRARMLDQTCFHPSALPLAVFLTRIALDQILLEIDRFQTESGHLLAVPDGTLSKSVWRW